MWLTFFATWEARGRALLYGTAFVIALVALGLLVHMMQGTF